MAARNSETEKGEFWMWCFCKMGQHMCLHVVYFNDGDVQSHCKRLGERSANDQRTDEAGATCKCDGTDFFFFHPCFF